MDQVLGLLYPWGRSGKKLQASVFGLAQPQLLQAIWAMEAEEDRSLSVSFSVNSFKQIAPYKFLLI